MDNSSDGLNISMKIDGNEIQLGLVDESTTNNSNKENSSETPSNPSMTFSGSDLMINNFNDMMERVGENIEGGTVTIDKVENTEKSTDEQENIDEKDSTGTNENASDNDSDEILIPDLDQINQELGSNDKLNSLDVTDTITKKVVKTIIMDETTEFLTPSYLLDFSEIKEVMPCVLRGLESIINPDGNTAIYIKTNTGDIVQVGFGDATVLYKVLEYYLESAFNGRVKVYLNKGKGFKLSQALTVDDVILDI